MKTSLRLTVGTQLKLTPKLQQAIRLLQLSTLDLRYEIQQRLDSNPLLELDAETDSELDEFSEPLFATFYKKQEPGHRFNESDYVMNTLHCTTIDLKDHLRWQLELMPFSAMDRAIGELIIDSISPEGYLTTPIDDLLASINSKEMPLTREEIEVIRHHILRFDPIGCGALDLKESLLIQLEQVAIKKPMKALVSRLIQFDLNRIAKKKYSALAHSYRVKEKALDVAIHVIQSLHPNPGHLIAPLDAEYVIPDVVVQKKGEEWVVALNERVLPHLTINAQYASLIERANTSRDNQFLKTNLTDARWFLRSLKTRQETLLHVATCVMERQRDFLMQGKSHMNPLNLKEIARMLGVHESTVSRVTTQKFIETPQGVFELKYFFSNALPTTKGEACSSTSIQAMIKDWIEHENRLKPLTDLQLVKRMADSGIQIARRTIAKYREGMNIAAAHARKLHSN